MRLTTSVAALAVLAIGLGACGGEGGDSPQSSDIPGNAVAVVGDTAISRAELEDQIAALRRGRSQSGGTDGGQEAREDTRKRLQQQALSALVLAEAIEQEAADRGIEVPAAEVRRRWRAIAADQFPTKRALLRFLGGQTEQDAIAQLRLQVLTERVDAQISEKAGDGKDGAKAVKEFRQEFLERWRERTACRDDRSGGLCASDG
jgi:hypothetical protein